MKYRDLFNGIVPAGQLPAGSAQLVTQDSRKISPGAVFVCIQGRGFDGHDFAKAALQAGAGLVVTQCPLGLANEVTVPDTRAAYAALCANFFKHPGGKLVLVAVTGTNGKTTVSSVLTQMLQTLGLRCGLIGTIHTEIGDMQIPAKFTTPDAWDLNALLARMVAAGCTHVVMEASSQALEQGRVLGLQFTLAIFTNLTQDHLDYHGTMEQYFEAKKILFGQTDKMLVNADDEWGRKLLPAATGTPLCGEIRTFAAKGQRADFMAQDVRLRADGVRFALQGEDFLLPVAFPMLGEYSVNNALAAGGAAIMLGFAPQKVALALGSAKGVLGRCEVIYSGDFTVIRDFAHTADGIEQLLSALRPFAKQRLVVLYGCTGDRDAAKRFPMGQAAARYADTIYLSSDNPRSENPETILQDAKRPLQQSGKPFVAQADRAKAIALALAQMQVGDMLVLCGKGHEDYQVMNGVTHYFDERQVVQQWLQSNRL